MHVTTDLSCFRSMPVLCCPELHPREPARLPAGGGNWLRDHLCFASGPWTESQVPTTVWEAGSPQAFSAHQQLWCVRHHTGGGEITSAFLYTLHLIVIITETAQGSEKSYSTSHCHHNDDSGVWESSSLPSMQVITETELNICLSTGRLHHYHCSIGGMCFPKTSLL